MSHVRQQVGEATILALKGAMVGDRVYEETGRSLDADEVGVACIVVRTGDEAVESDATGKMRALDLFIVVGAPVGDSAQATINALIAFIETTLDDGVVIGGKTVDFQAGSIKTDLAAETERRLVAASVAYRAIYRTAHGAPEVFL